MTNKLIERLITDLSGQLFFGIEDHKEVVTTGFRQTIARLYKEDVGILGWQYSELLNYISLSERSLLFSAPRARLKFFNLHGLRNSINGCRKSAFKIAMEYRFGCLEANEYNLVQKTVFAKLNKVKRELEKFPSLKRMCDEMSADIILDLNYAGGVSDSMSARLNYFSNWLLKTNIKQCITVSAGSTPPGTA